jgi:DNA repair photolyase
MSESLSVYWGGLFGNGCLPLEMSMNWCSMGCSYCFANLNSPNRAANTPQIMGMLAHHQEKSTYAARLLHAGYPTVISNHVDPFASSNEAIALPILEAMTELGLPYSIQTKCGKAGYEAMKFMPPIVFYISIATMNEEVLQRVEPGAPSAQERFRFIEHARSLGHRVCVGINPCVDEWVGDPTELCKTLETIGVEGVWVQPLHLSNRQIAAMSDREKAAIGEAVLNKARRFRKDPTMREAYLKTRYAAESHGMEVYDAWTARAHRLLSPL